MEWPLREPSVLANGTDLGGHLGPGRRLRLRERGALIGVQVSRQPDPATGQEVREPLRSHPRMKPQPGQSGNQALPGMLTTETLGRRLKGYGCGRSRTARASGRRSTILRNNHAYDERLARGAM